MNDKIISIACCRSRTEDIYTRSMPHNQNKNVKKLNLFKFGENYSYLGSLPVPSDASYLGSPRYLVTPVTEDGEGSWYHCSMYSVTPCTVYSVTPCTGYLVTLVLGTR